MFANKNKVPLSPQVVLDIINSCTYKDGVQITGKFTGYGYVVDIKYLINKSATTEFLLEEGEFLQLNGTMRIPVEFFTSELEVKEFIRTFIISTEIHEAEEWIKFNGEQFCNPHDLYHKLPTSFYDLTNHKLYSIRYEGSLTQLG